MIEETQSFMGDVLDLDRRGVQRLEVDANYSEFRDENNPQEISTYSPLSSLQLTRKEVRERQRRGMELDTVDFQRVLPEVVWAEQLGVVGVEESKDFMGESQPFASLEIHRWRVKVVAKANGLDHTNLLQKGRT